MLPDTVAGFLAGRYEFTITDKSKAIFAQATYHITDALNFTAGGRYTWEKHLAAAHHVQQQPRRLRQAQGQQAELAVQP
ncbi:TonB-dependent receptor domain-containing protein [Novosphingobium colocasiae]